MSISRGRLWETSVATVLMKRGSVRRNQLAARVAAYREALMAQCLTVAATWIHLPLAGGMIRMSLVPDEAESS